MRPALAIATTLTALALSAGSALACSCLRPESAAQHAREADVVFKGTPIGSRRTREGDAVTVFRVGDVLKGRLGSTVEVLHGTSSAACGLTFRPGQPVLVLADRAAGGRISTNLCWQPMFSERQYRQALGGGGRGPGPVGRCEPLRAEFAVGEAYTRRLGERALQRSGARTLRVRRPGEAYTMDYRPDRLNLDLDRMNRVRSVSCG